MIIRIENGLPFATVKLAFGKKTIELYNVLIDTGCAVTIFDTDLLAEVGLEIDFVNGRPVTMYGVGGKGEVFYQQLVNGLLIDDQRLNNFNLQLGIVKDMYGFDGILGIDYMLNMGLILDFSTLEANYADYLKDF